MEYLGLPYLQDKLNRVSAHCKVRYMFYEMKNKTFDFGISTPPELKKWNSVVGWCAKTVDALADRLDFYKFKDDIFGLEEIYNQNNKDVLIDSAVLGSLITSCDFIYISEDETGYPRMEVIDGCNATGVIDVTTNLMNEGYAILERDIMGNPVREAYFTKEYTAYYENGRLTDTRKNKAPYALLVPIIYRPDAKRPFGHSRISRACMEHTASAIRTIKRSEIAAEFYSFPQKYVTGIDNTSESFDKWAATMSAMLKFGLNSDGNDHVKVGQFSQQSMGPHVDQLKMFASLFAGESGLTLEDLGFPSNNPSSSEAIKAAHENLRVSANKAHKCFGNGLINAGYLCACIRDNVKYSRSQLYMTKALWSPVFPADVTMLGSIGDALGKLETAIPGYITEEKLYQLTGI